MRMVVFIHYYTPEHPKDKAVLSANWEACSTGSAGTCTPRERPGGSLKSPRRRRIDCLRKRRRGFIRLIFHICASKALSLFRRRSQDSGDLVVNYVCRDRAEGLWQYAVRSKPACRPRPTAVRGCMLMT